MSLAGAQESCHVVNRQSRTLNGRNSDQLVEPDSRHTTGQCLPAVCAMRQVDDNNGEIKTDRLNTGPAQFEVDCRNMLQYVPQILSGRHPCLALLGRHGCTT